MASAAVPESTTATIVRLSMPAKAEYIALSRLALSGLARARPLAGETLADLKLALSEACSNSVRHAYRDGRAGVVDIVYELAADHIAIEVSDDGNGFRREEFQRQEPDLSEGGLGIAIIRALSDEFDVGARPDGSGVRLRFVKHLTD